jgi:outer membrane protein assembly factor BamB
MEKKQRATNMKTVSARTRFLRFASVLALSATLAGCGSGSGNLIDKISGKNDEILPGKREAALSRGQVKLASEPVVIPTAITNSSWAQPGGVPSNSLQNLSLGRKLRRAFAVSAGEGSGGSGRLIAMPIVVAGRVFVMDSQSNVRAFSANNGAPAWAVSLVPRGRSPESAFGGGLASDGNTIFATTAYGEVVALSLSNGGELWRKKVSGPVKTAPTVAGGQVYFVTINNEVNALAASNGAPLWKTDGAGTTASALSNTSPAVSGGVVVAPLTTGELAAYSSAGGQRFWNENLSSSQGGGNLNSISGRPVVAGGQVYAISNNGRMAAFSLKSGIEVWSREISGNQTPWVSGEYVFVISQRRRLAAISRKDGSIKWVAELPGGGRWSGPVMGGGRLLAVSNKGVLASISPQTGQLMNKLSVGEAFYIAPVIAGNTVYLLDDNANLIAMR